MKKEHCYYVYILESKRNGTLYIGVTSSLYRRTLEHQSNENKNSFTALHNVKRLVYYEMYANIDDAIKREKQLKKWNREWKINLIEKENSTWRDLFHDME